MYQAARVIDTRSNTFLRTMCLTTTPKEVRCEALRTVPPSSTRARSRFLLAGNGSRTTHPQETVNAEALRTPRGRSFDQESNVIKRRAGTSINTHLGVPPYAQNMGIDEEQHS